MKEKLKPIQTKAETCFKALHLVTVLNLFSS